jgi:preprotein translocase subunit SecE
MKSYKEDQGRLTRMAAFWSVVLLLLFGCTFLYDMLIGMDSMGRAIGGIRIPIVSIDLNGAFAIAGIVFLVGLIVIRRWQQTPKVADLLIDTESELRKVTWPTMNEVINSSIVVIVSVILMGMFLAAADWVLGKLMQRLILGI